MLLCQEKDLQCSCVKGRTNSVAESQVGITVLLCQEKDLQCSCVKGRTKSVAGSQVGLTWCS